MTLSTRTAGAWIPARLPVLGDERLGRLATAGHERAFAVVYDRYHQPLYRYCRSILRHEADAQDALQATFAAALAALQRDQRDAPMRPWLFRIAHNEAISLLRRRRPTAELSAATECPSPSVEERVDERNRLELLVRDMGELAERQRSALVMRELSGLSHEEIATALGTSVGAAKQAIFEARRSLLEFAEGRAMSCEEIQRLISDSDGRHLRSRRVRGHVRECSDCRAFATAIPSRSADLRALAPALPTLAVATLVHRIAAAGSGHGAGGMGGGAAGSTAGIAAATAGKTAGGILAANALAGAAAVATATLGVTVGLHRIDASPPRATAPARSQAGAPGAPARSAPGRVASVPAPGAPGAATVRSARGSSSSRTASRSMLAPPRGRAHGGGSGSQATEQARARTHSRASHHGSPSPPRSNSTAEVRSNRPTWAASGHSTRNGPTLVTPARTHGQRSQSSAYGSDVNSKPARPSPGRPTVQRKQNESPGQARGVGRRGGAVAGAGGSARGAAGQQTGASHPSRGPVPAVPPRPAVPPGHAGTSG